MVYCLVATRVGVCKLQVQRDDHKGEEDIKLILFSELLFFQCKAIHHSFSIKVLFIPRSKALLSFEVNIVFDIKICAPYKSEHYRLQVFRSFMHHNTPLEKKKLILYSGYRTCIHKT